MENPSVPTNTPASEYAQLPDKWEPAQFIPLNGGLERQQFSPILTAFFGLVLALILFHIVIGPVATVLLLMMDGVAVDELLNLFASPDQLIASNARALLIANTIGQVLALAVPILLIVGFHSKKRWAFLRFRTPDWTLVGLSIVGLIGLTPLSWWLGNLNAAIPMPEWVDTLEATQIQLIEQVLEQNLGILFSLAVMALTPAFCEEILFRGYLQRQLERSFGAIAAIIVIGIVFGMFHFRFTQLIPLSVIGMYLAYLTWRSGSIWLAIIIHFANNAFAVGLGLYITTREDISLESLERMDVPVPWLLLAVVVLGGALYLMDKVAKQRIAEQAEVSNAA